MEELELFFLDKIKPYEERIRKLEESERQKEYEITTLKHAVHNLNRIVEDLKSKQTAAVAAVRGPATTGKGPAGGAKPGITNAPTKSGPRPQTAKTDTKADVKADAKTTPAKKDTKAADLKKGGKDVKAEKPAESEAPAPAATTEENTETQEKKEPEVAQTE